MSKEIPGQNRGFCFLEFYNHACAQHAKAALSPPNFQCVPLNSIAAFLHCNRPGRHCLSRLLTGCRLASVTVIVSLVS